MHIDIAAVRPGDQIIVDGVSGLVFVNPEPPVQTEYERLDGEFRAYKNGLQQVASLPSVTADGTSIVLLANVNKFADTEAALLYQADGVGLYRTEFGFSVRSAFPTEDEQYEFLKRAAERLHPRPMTLRQLDVGADKQLSYFPLPPSRNPSLSERGVRLLLKYPAVLKTQLRAFLRGSGDHPVGILLPGVGSVEEIRGVKAMIADVMTEFSTEGKPFDPHVPVGAMIEISSAAPVAETMADEVDLEDESPVPYYEPLHPAVLRLIRSVTEAAGQASRPLTICGEMARSCPSQIAQLLSLGWRHEARPYQAVREKIGNQPRHWRRSCDREHYEYAQAFASTNSNSIGKWTLRVWPLRVPAPARFRSMANRWRSGRCPNPSRSSGRGTRPSMSASTRARQLTMPTTRCRSPSPASCRR